VDELGGERQGVLGRALGDPVVGGAARELGAGEVGAEAGDVVRGDLETDREQGAGGGAQRHHRAPGARGDRLALLDQPRADELLDELRDGRLGEPRQGREARAGGGGGGGLQGAEDGREVVLAQVGGLHRVPPLLVVGAGVTGGCAARLVRNSFPCVD
jgi:hypothetical protein